MLSDLPVGIPNCRHNILTAHLTLDLSLLFLTLPDSCTYITPFMNSSEAGKGDSDRQEKLKCSISK